MDTLSEGRDCLFHLAAVDSSVKSLIGSFSGLVVILLALKNLSKSYLIILSLKLLLKGPAYDTNAEASNTSPTIYLRLESNKTIEFAQR